MQLKITLVFTQISAVIRVTSTVNGLENVFRTEIAAVRRPDNTSAMDVTV